MARIRTIKPETWSDVRFGECSSNARLLFIGSWNFADDHGNLPRNPKQLKAQIFPYDSLDCEPLVQELLRHSLLQEYEVNGVNYLNIKNFLKHQKIDKPGKCTIPECKFDEHSPNDSRTFAPEGKGREGNGREWKELTPTAKNDEIVFQIAKSYPKLSHLNSDAELNPVICQKIILAIETDGAEKVLRGTLAYAAQLQERKFCIKAEKFFGDFEYRAHTGNGLKAPAPGQSFAERNSQ